jgi:tetratricopeptide (TPR) repeat protein
MLQRLGVFILGIIACYSVHAQQASSNEVLTTARGFSSKGDISNAILVLKNAHNGNPADMNISKELAINYLRISDNTKAKETLTPLVSNHTADDQVYQLLGSIYKMGDEEKDAEKLYKEALAKYPDSGPLYNEYGELLYALKRKNAIEVWEKGIAADPQFPGNYYNATKFYALNHDRVWPLIYGEIFVNLEPATVRTPEIKKLLLDAYKNFYLSDKEPRATKENFRSTFVNELEQQRQFVDKGITPESLIALRTSLAMNWQEHLALKYPLELMAFHQHLLQEGLFEAYNEWLFGSADNAAAYKNWMETHKDEQAAFSEYQRKRLFKQPKGQFYNN